MKIFILTLGTRGDLELFLILGRELRRRGHRVLIGSSPFHARDVYAAQLEFQPVGNGSHDQMNEAVRAMSSNLDPKQRTLAFIQNWIAPQLNESMRIVLLAAASSHCFINNMKMTVQHKGQAVVGAYVTYDVPEKLEDLQRPGPGRNDGRILELVALNKHLIDPQNQWASKFHFTGFWSQTQPMAHPPPKGLAEFVNAGSAPVVVTLGSMTPLAGPALARGIIEALRYSGRRGIILGASVNPRRPLPGGIHVCGYVPYGWLFPRACCVVHHGGVGTVAAALASGIPSVLLPQISAQVFMSEVLARNGLATAAFPVGQVDAAALGEAIGRATSIDVQAHAKSWQARLSSDGGAAAAADAIEAHCRRLQHES